MAEGREKMKAGVFVHPTALIEEGVRLGEGTSVWNNVHIRRNATIGDNCIIGEKTYIAYDVKIGNLVKMNAYVYICAGVIIKDKVMISAGTVFTNDLFPRATPVGQDVLITSAPTEETLETTVEEGVTIGANATIGCGIILGEYCMVGMGSVVTKDIPPYTLVYGSPARIKGWVCKCGKVLNMENKLAVCSHCDLKYEVVIVEGAKKIIPL